ncbi:hypothetical protein BJ508DRAFT_336126 [Ascobolus immersus RN42]|uniref:Uncharacterized protein n=1 Tax=Ascobolus immersus RN42 TaxID=1160509 RepID=A0A3N4H9L8_ASCIM|nr:hypothetical protein BJ508DRAFT_336126 [Ascobolus immersus RN42]
MDVPSLVVVSVKPPGKPGQPLLRTLTSTQMTPQLSHLLESSLTLSHAAEQLETLIPVHVRVAQYAPQGSRVSEVEALATREVLNDLSHHRMNALRHLVIVHRHHKFHSLQLLNPNNPDLRASRQNSGPRLWTEQWISMISRASTLGSTAPMLMLNDSPASNNHESPPVTPTDLVMAKRVTADVNHTRLSTDGTAGHQQVAEDSSVVKRESNETANSSVVKREATEDKGDHTMVKEDPNEDRTVTDPTADEEQGPPVCPLASLFPLRIPRASSFPFEEVLDVDKETATPPMPGTYSPVFNTRLLAAEESSDTPRENPPLALIRDAIKLYTAANGLRIGARLRVTRVRAHTDKMLWADLALNHPSPFYSKRDLVDLTSRFNTLPVFHQHVSATCIHHHHPCRAPLGNANLRRHCRTKESLADPRRR